MKNTNAPTTAIILETRTPRKDGRCPVKLRIIHNRQARYFSLKDETGANMSLFKNEFERVRGQKPRGEYKELAIYLNEIEKLARETIKGLHVFSFDLFEKRFFGKYGDEQDLFSAFQNTITKLKEESRISTAKSYECALHSLKAYTQKNTLLFEKLDISFLNKYEKWMSENRNSPTTTGIYMRYIRTCFNEAIRNNIIKSELYPFGRGKYQIPAGRNIKKALSQKEISLIASYPAIDGTNEQRYRDYWLFLFLCSGINVTDMAKLKYQNIEDDVIVFHRQKTKRELKSHLRIIKVVITQQLGRIIDRWGNKPATSDQYIFPILKNEMPPEQEYTAIHQAIKMINKYIKRVAKATGIKNEITSYTARHSFATILKYSGASIEYISESLGHSNLQTTENYLADFEISEKRKWAKIVEETLKIKN